MLFCNRCSFAHTFRMERPLFMRRHVVFSMQLQQWAALDLASNLFAARGQFHRGTVHLTNVIEIRLWRCVSVHSYICCRRFFFFFVRYAHVHTAYTRTCHLLHAPLRQKIKTYSRRQCRKQRPPATVSRSKSENYWTKKQRLWLKNKTSPSANVRIAYDMRRRRCQVFVLRSRKLM